MNTWYISDTHFYHTNIIRYCNRPFSSVEEMNETLIRNWNDRVSQSDTVWHLGDFTFGGSKRTEELLKRLNGTKNLILGNHDPLSKTRYLQLGFSRVEKEVHIDADGQHLVLNHYPAPFFQADDEILLHGHVHGARAKRVS